MRSRARAAGRRITGLLLVLSVGIGTTAYLFHADQRRRIIEHAGEDLLAIAGIKVAAITDWRKDMFGDAAAVALSSEVKDFLTQPSLNSERRLRGWLEAFNQHEGYGELVVFNREGLPVMSSEAGAGVVAPAVLSRVREAVAAGQMGFLDLHKHEGAETPAHLAVFAPVVGQPTGERIGAITLSIDPSHSIYSHASMWPALGSSAEALIVRRQGREFVYLTRLRRPPDASFLKAPIEGIDPSAAMAARGFQGVVEGRDYSGVPVLAAVREVPDTNWLLVAKIDIEEIEGTLRRTALFTGLAAALLIAGAWAGVMLAWRKRQLDAEAERLAVSRQYEYLHMHANDIILLADAELRIVGANERALACYGYRAEEIRDLPLFRLFACGDIQAHTGTFEEEHRRKDGSTFPVEVSARFLEANGRRYYHAIVRDITIRRRHEEEMDRLNRSLRVLSASNHAVIRATDEEALAGEVCRILVAAGYRAAWVGYPSGEASGRVVPVASEGIALDALIREGASRPVDGPESAPGEAPQRLLVGGREDTGGSTIILPLRYNDVGYGIVVLINAQRPVCDEALEAGLLSELAADLAFGIHVLRTRAAQRESETRYRQLFDEIPVGVYRTTPDGRILSANPALVRMLGFSSFEELAGRNLNDESFRPEYPREHFKRRIEREGRVVYESLWKRADGSSVPVREHTVAIRDDSGSVVAYEGTVEDITEAKEALKALRQSEAGLRQIFETAEEGIWKVDEQGRTVSANEKMTRMVGYEPGEMAGMPFLDFVDDCSRGIARKCLSQHGDKTGNPHDLRLRRKDGSSFWSLTSTSPIRDNNGQHTGTLALVMDVTDRKRLEEDLQQAHKMEAIGHLAAGVAHDFNNLLTVIIGHGELLLGKTEANSVLQQHAEEILFACDRASNLTDQLLAFSRRKVAEPSVFDLNEAVKDIERLLRHLIGEDIALDVCVSQNLEYVLADRAGIDQVLLNLVLNARDAMPSGGLLSIQTEHAIVGPEDVPDRARGQVAPGCYVLLSVRDNGIGMNAETLSHIFEPFFTTKPRDSGTGLGLSTAYGIVAQAGGYIKVESVPGAGSTFNVYLPLVEAPGVGSKQAVDKPRGWADIAGSETVLVVEDELSVRTVVRSVLEELGYLVLETGDVEDAERICCEHPGPIPLMITDMVMPKLSGKALADVLRAIRPDMRVLFMSGYSDSTLAAQGLLASGAWFIRKPFVPERLGERVRQILDQPDERPRSVLVADDDSQVRKLIRMVLESSGYEVEEAENGKEALRKAGETKFDAFLTDLIMPEQEGLETIQKMRHGLPELRIVAMSGAADPTYLEAAHHLGARATLRKPISPQTLVETMQQVCGEPVHPKP